MNKIYLILLALLFITNCSVPGSALLGPAFTGATTKSVAQATLSFGTNQIIQNIKDASEIGKKETIKIVKRFDDFTEVVSNKGFYTSVKSLYLQDQKKVKETFLFHR